MHRPRLRLGIAAACALAAVGVGVTAAPAGAASTLAIHGADLSTLQRAEDLGAKYYNQNGTQGDPLQILKAAGMNYVRLRVWVNPASGYNNQSKVVAFGKQVKAAGLKLLVDFHYSDTWADPGKQFTPAAWNGHSLSQLETDVYQYTFNVCNALKAAGATPDMVQVGNEINAGMLWSEGSTDNWSQLAGLINSGYSAVKAVSSGTQVALHLANAGDDSTVRWWFDNAKTYGINYDVIGLSYYGYWHGSLAAAQTTLDDVVSRYGKPVFVAETAYPFTLAQDDSLENQIDTTGELVTGYPATQAGQLAWMNAVANIVEAVPGNKGLGVFYWEATWTAVTGNGWDPTDSASGNGWENQALFDYNDRATSAMSWFSHR